jgi:lipoprotein-releasing system permease protein
MSNVLSARNLRKRFLDGERELRVLDGIDLDIRRGERVAVVGRSGTGIGYFLGVLAEAGFPTLESLLGVKLMSEYVVDTLPFAMALTDVWHVAGIAGLLTLLATLYPAWRASSSSPAEALQHE